MWYLIIPPFIIVLSLGALLWFLSRRMGDADIAEKLSSMKGSTQAESHSRSLSRRAFFLKLLETLASKFKTGTLRIHNFFQHSLEGLRRQRTEIDAMRKNLSEGIGRAKEKGTERSSIFDRRNVPAASASRAFLEDTLLIGGESELVAGKTESRSVGPDVVSNREGIAGRPMLRENVARPETHAGRRQESPREETLIARIVENPRDAAAYEELGDCYFGARNLQDAKECYRQALKLHPTNRAVKIKIRRLEKVFEERAR
jgi:tetratricopeptide (TPR) repeat protein